MDGIARYGKDKWLISDFIKGEILLINKTGQVEKTIVSKKGAADIVYVAEKNLLVVPLLMDSQVSAYKVE